MQASSRLLGCFGIREGELAESVEGDALHKAGWDDPVGVDVIAGDEDSATGDLGDFFESHGWKKLNVKR
jgi:hypothetical protein